MYNIILVIQKHISGLSFIRCAVHYTVAVAAALKRRLGLNTRLILIIFLLSLLENSELDE